ncbi:MAG: hypothetical protein JW936_08630 [Sedimentisphaerales bacterium]|nr:hypothetical protein [Sedimentisphaerales bacterium]
MATTNCSTKTYSAHYISGTHWDREWYRPFQEFRILLVDMVDLLLDLMEQKSEFKYFHFDGQTCMLEDYLEIRPENRDRLAKLITDGRILIGPWFTMPDLFGPGDEALIRNLLLGRKIAQQWGVEPMNVAYTCDMFGHPSQMPQIYQGFGMQDCVLGRGTNEHTTPAFFNWQAPDGSEVFTFKLQDHDGYGAFIRCRNVLESMGDSPDEDTVNRAKEELRKYVSHEESRSNVPVLCLMDALDHTLPATDAPRYLQILHDACPDVQGCHSTLSAFFNEARAKSKNLVTKHGELREPAKEGGGYLYLIPNCPSSRVRMKQANDRSQNLLEKWAEPFFAWAQLEGDTTSPAFLDVAWKYLLQCHAHDSICGCSIDQVHRDMMYRFDQTQIIATQARNRAFGDLTASCADLAQTEDEFTITIANPLPYARKEVVTFNVDLHHKYPTSFCDGFRGHFIKSFTFSDIDGNDVPYQRLVCHPDSIARTSYAVPARDGSYLFDRYVVAAEIDLPPLGFTSLLVKPSKKPVRRMTSLRTGPNSAENEHLAVSIAPNGTVTLTDKATNEIYTDLLTLEDRSEVGDGWFHVDSVNDEIALSSACQGQVSVLHDGPDLVTFRIAVPLDLPCRYDFHKQTRSQDRLEMTVVHLVTLRRGARVVDVETTFDNNVEDHRLRLLLPTDADADSYLAHHPFDFVSRPIALDTSTAGWREAELSEKPFLSMQAVGAKNRGLAFISEAGLHEGGVLDDARRTMAVTLMRSFRLTVATNGETDGLELGQHSYRFKLMPFAGQLPRIQALNELAKLQTGTLTRQTQNGEFESGYPAMNGTMQPRRSFLSFQDNNLVPAAIKPQDAGGNLTIRLWNPCEKAQSETIKFYRPPKKAQYTDLAERAIADSEPQLKNDSVTVTAGPHQIITIAVDF